MLASFAVRTSCRPSSLTILRSAVASGRWMILHGNNSSNKSTARSGSSTTTMSAAMHSSLTRRAVILSTRTTTRPAEEWKLLSSMPKRRFLSTAAAAVPQQEEEIIYPLSNRHQDIRILYASQGGTAQLFAQQLAEALEDYYQQLGKDDIPQVTVQGWHEYPRQQPPGQLLTPGQALHIFLVSVTGVGEPPDNGRAFYEWLTASKPTDPDTAGLTDLEYAVFGLGNSKAHPSHYNVIGIALDQRLLELGAKRVHPLGLGDDGDCLEDDFDKWMESVMKLISSTSTSTEAQEEERQEEESPAEVDTETMIVVEPNNKKELPTTECVPGVAKSPGDRRRLVSSKHATLQLAPRTHIHARHDLFHLQPHNAFYSPNTVRARVTTSRALSPYAGESGLREVALAIPSTTQYTTGDHCLVYPRNAGCIVEAYLQLLDVDPHAIIEGTVDSTATTSYPYPKRLTVYETLSHCVDLGAIPSPSFARFLLDRKEVDYKQEIAGPRRTVLDLLLSTGNKPQISLEDLLYNLAPMKPRYYSIASSSVASPKEVKLTFRPVKYVTSQGQLREGVCTNYMATVVAPMDNNDDSEQYLPVCIAENPTFRLPKDPQTPVLLIAGGCGVAPIRAFVQERVALAKQQQQKFGPGLIYLGFRSPEDEVYRPLLKEALEVGALTLAKVAYSNGCVTCQNVNELVHSESQRVWDHMESGGVTYLCGGARTFGAAIEKELLELIQEHGQMDFAGAETYMRNLIDTGRLLEDLAD